MDKIILNNMEFFGYHGVFDSEKQNGQRFIVSLTMFLDLTLPALTDNVADTVNYADVYDIIKRIVTVERYDLLETLANRIAVQILDSFISVESVCVKVDKPDAPIEGYNMGPSVELTVERPDEWQDAYIAFGSNLGDSYNTLVNAVKALDAVDSIRVVKVSSVYKTKPVGLLEQPDFLNGVVKIETCLSPEQLLDVTQRIENDFGRVRTVRNGARTLDLDILLLGRRRINSERLILPHERMFERAFVLVPLMDVGAFENRIGKDMIEKCSDKDDIEYFAGPFEW